MHYCCKPVTVHAVDWVDKPGHLADQNSPPLPGLLAGACVKDACYNIVA